MMNLTQLQVPAKKVFIGVLIYALAGLVYSVINPLHSLLPLGGGPVVTSSYYAALAAIIVGYVFTFIGLNGFRQFVDSVDKKSIGSVRMSYIILVIAAIADCMPFMEWIAGVLTFISAIVLVMGFSKLKKSNNFNVDMKRGFSTLFIASILILVGECLDFIPLAGDYLWGVFNFIALIVTIIGWSKVKSGAAKA
jgi:hypothetical protein